eukprot:TRINITY_DN83367_c0_g1_i1.p1 TRINITY_DN83367_c0_g1~~TRINITY_DN83367_c0_g1_i1.p1  ORF type:complete len:398 (-),score=70.93 TRINITY_DN83367_c0_g1_i1:84-1136(-)
MTAHPCKNSAETVCDTAVAGSADACKAECDSAGADTNLFREKGPGNALYDLIDPALPVTVRTLFETTDGTSTGDLKEIKQIFEQETAAGKKTFTQKLTDEKVKTTKAKYGEPNSFGDTYGGLKQMGESLKKGMVLVLALWSDTGGNMNWLDSCSAKETEYNCSANSRFTDEVYKESLKVKPGAWRGPVDYFPSRAKSFDIDPPTTTLSYPGIPVPYRTQPKFTCNGCKGAPSVTKVTCNCAAVPYEFTVSNIKVTSKEKDPAATPVKPPHPKASGKSGVPVTVPEKTGANTWVRLALVTSAVLAVALIAAACCCYHCNEDETEEVATVGSGRRKHMKIVDSSASSEEDWS